MPYNAFFAKQKHYDSHTIQQFNNSLYQNHCQTFILYLNENRVNIGKIMEIDNFEA